MNGHSLTGRSLDGKPRLAWSAPMEWLSPCLRDSLCSAGLTLGLSGAAILLLAAALIFGSTAVLLLHQRQRQRRLGADPVPHFIDDEAPTVRWQRGEAVRRAA